MSITIGITRHRFIEDEDSVKQALADKIDEIVRENKDKKNCGL